MDKHSNTQAATGGYRFPGDGEKHDAVWLSWPTYEPKKGSPTSSPILDAIRAMDQHVNVHLIVQDAQDEEGVRLLAESRSVPLSHVKFFHVPHDGIWTRDNGPQFAKNAKGELAIVDWNFNLWGYEEPEHEISLLEEAVHREIAKQLNLPLIDVADQNGLRLIHEGGSVTHNGHRTMIAVESIVMQRALGPNRLCGGAPLLSDYSSPTTYEQRSDWAACKSHVERIYRKALGVQKVIWVPTGVIEDDGTYRGAIAKHIHVSQFEGHEISSPGVYTMATTNGHADEFVRFVSEDTVLLAQAEVPHLKDDPSDLDRLVHFLETENHKRLEAAFDILSNATTCDGKPLKVVRMPSPVFMFDVMQQGDGLYDFLKNYSHWEDDSRLPDKMFSVLPASYMNYLSTNGVILFPKYWKEGRPLLMKDRDEQAVKIIRNAFPDREVAQIEIENVNYGGGGIHCMSQQQPSRDVYYIS